MNSKRAKNLRRMSVENGIAYDSLKNLYNLFGRASEQEAKRLKQSINENKHNSPQSITTTTGGSNSEEMAE